MVSVTKSNYNNGNMKFQVDLKRYSSITTYGKCKIEQAKSVKFADIPRSSGEISKLFILMTISMVRNKKYL